MTHHRNVMKYCLIGLFAGVIACGWLLAGSPDGDVTPKAKADETINTAELDVFEAATKVIRSESSTPAERIEAFTSVTGVKAPLWDHLSNRYYGRSGLRRSIEVDRWLVEHIDFVTYGLRPEKRPIGIIALQHRGWYALPPIMEALETETSEDRVRLMCRALANLGVDRAMGIISSELKVLETDGIVELDAPSRGNGQHATQYAKNLLVIKQMLREGQERREAAIRRRMGNSD